MSTKLKVLFRLAYAKTMDYGSFQVPSRCRDGAGACVKQQHLFLLEQEAGLLDCNFISAIKQQGLWSTHLGFVIF